jgi:hypothetical protein
VDGVASRRRPKPRYIALAAALVVIIGATAAIGGRMLATSHGPQAAPAVSRVLYSFNDGSTHGWRAGANVEFVSAVSTFPDSPGSPYASNYALDATPVGAFVPAPLTMTVAPATPLDMSAANSFHLYLDGYGDPPYAVSYDATVTLASGSHTLTKTAAVSCNAWNRMDVDVSSWPYRDHVTGISVSYKGIASGAGVTTKWFPHFEIDDVGYTT